MKRILVLAIVVIAFSACQQHASKANGTSTESSSPNIKPSPNAAILTFEEDHHDFGKIKQGESVRYEFKFKNTGKSPLIVNSAYATCGCTIPETPKDPIKPGDSGVIKVVFNSTGKMGMQDKIIMVNSNGNPKSNEVHLTGEVTAPK